MILPSVGGQTCIESVDVQQIGNNHVTPDRLGIVPNLNFNCSARITRIRVRLHPYSHRSEYPYMQVWRLSSQYPTVYNKVAQVLVTKSHITNLKYTEANIPLNGLNRIPVQSGDVIGYYHPNNAGFRVETIQTPGYELYEFHNDGSTSTSVDLNNAYHKFTLHQPLIHFTLGKLLAIVSCY